MSTQSIFFIDLLARSAVILGIAWAIVRALPKLSAASRYWIWLTALCILPLLLVTMKFPARNLVTFPPKAEQLAEKPFLRPLEIGMSAEPESIDNAVPSAAAEAPVSPPVAAAPMSAPGRVPQLAPAASEPGTGTSAFVLVYLVGVFASLLPLAIGLVRLQRLRSLAYPAADSDGLATASCAEVLLSAQVSVPMTWGTMRPVILLPEAAKAWTGERRRVVFAHEGAHITRRDFATGLLASLVRALFWFQPLAWYAHRRLRAERELACDDLVLRSQASAPADYAEHLSAVVSGAGSGSPGAAIAMARPSEIVGRVRAILDLARNRASLSARAKQRIALLALVLFTPLAFVRCAGEKSMTEKTHKTGIGIELKEVDPSAIKITIDGESIDVPGGKKFSMATREVSQAEFQELLGHNPSSTEAAHLPVDRVTRTEAATFCKVLTTRDQGAGILPKGKIYRLPTTREWLLAALPGGLVPEGEALDAIAWHGENSAGLLHPVGAKKANAYGLHDMLGNAAEWADPDEELAKAAANRSVGRYLGRVMLQLTRPVDEAGAASSKGEISYNTFIQTQFAVIESRRVLEPVVRKLDLAGRWNLASDGAAVERLAKRMKVQAIRGTELIEISHYSDEAEEAAELANAIASAYIDVIEGADRDRSRLVLEQLEHESKSQEKLMEESRKAMLELMRESGFTELGGGSPRWMGSEFETGSGALVMRSKVDEHDAKAELEGLRSTIKTLMDLEGDELIEAAVQLGLNNPTLTNRYPEFQSAQLRLEALRSSGLGSEHPKILAAEQELSVMKTMLGEAVEQTKRSLETSMKMAEERLSGVRPTKKEVEADPIDERRRSVEYLAAKDEYELHKTLLAEMKQRIAIDRVNEKMPRKRVLIHERAVPQQVSRRVDPGSPVAIGGSVGDDREDLLRGGSSSYGEERSDHIGFRFVMADE